MLALVCWLVIAAIVGFGWGYDYGRASRRRERKAWYQATSELRRAGPTVAARTGRVVLPSTHEGPNDVA